MTGNMTATAAFTSTDTVPPARPTNVNVKSHKSNVCVLSWKANTAPDLAGYNVYHSLTSDWWVPPALGSTTKNTITCKELNLARDGKRHYFRISATDKSKNESTLSTKVSIVLK
jgi:hypothetical protein